MEVNFYIFYFLSDLSIYLFFFIYIFLSLMVGELVMGQTAGFFWGVGWIRSLVSCVNYHSFGSIFCVFYEELHLQLT